MKFPKKLILYLFLAIIFLSFRLSHLSDAVNFGADQGMHLLDIYRIYQTRRLTLIGAPSSWVTEGRSFFTGPAPYYLLLPVMWLGKWEPLVASYFLIAFQLCGFLFLTYVLDKVAKEPLTAFFVFLISATSGIIVEYSRFLWHPNYLISFSAGILAILLIIHHSKNKAFWNLLLGLFLGIGMQFHYSFVLAVIASILWLMVTERIRLRLFLLLTIGFCIGFSPLIIFELRHQFYNLSTFFTYMTKNTQSSTQIPVIPLYYLFPLTAFVLYGAARYLTILYKRQPLLSIIFAAVFVSINSIALFNIPQHGYTMPEGWNYKGLQKASQVILTFKPTQYNIVDILTGDTRALALRYLLTISGNPPLDVVSYPNSRMLFVYSRLSENEVLNNSLWEISSVQPLKLESKWEIQNGIRLYQFVKVNAAKVPNSVN